MNNYLKDFVREMKNRNYSTNTIRTYSTHIRHFLDFCIKSDLDPYKRISVFLYQEKSTNEQRRLAWSSIKLFYELVLKKECPYKLNKIRSVARLPDVLTNWEIKEVLNTIKNSKHRLIISFLYGSGLRVSEVCNIKIKDLDFTNLRLKIRNTKGNKDRITLISEKSISAIRKMIEGRGAEEFIFVTKTKKRYSIRTVQKIFSDALDKSQLQKHPTCHTLRHCFATHLVENGVNVKIIKGLLGHSSIKTTMIYIKLADSIHGELVSPL